MLFITVLQGPSAERQQCGVAGRCVDKPLWVVAPPSSPRVLFSPPNDRSVAGGRVLSSSSNACVRVTLSHQCVHTHSVQNPDLHISSRMRMFADPRRKVDAKLLTGLMQDFQSSAGGFP